MSIDYFNSFCSTSMFSGKIPKEGFFKVFLLAILFSRESSREGSNNKFANMANTRVTETNPPRATVPPKLERANTEKPKKTLLRDLTRKHGSRAKGVKIVNTHF